MNQPEQQIASILLNGSRLEAVGIGVDRKLMSYVASEFKERLRAAFEDEARHMVMERDMAKQVWDGPTRSSEGVLLIAHQFLHVAPVEWSIVAVNLLERVFEFRQRFVARHWRQLGFRFLHEPMMEIAKDEARHVRLMTDLMRAQLKSTFTPPLIQDVSRWMAENERADTSGFFYRTDLVPQMTERLLEDLRG